MNKLKLFVDNFIIYGMGGIISKMIPLIMVPIITRLMPSTGYYGIADLSNTLVQFGSAIAIMGMYDAMYRMFFEKEEPFFKKKVCSTALSFTMITSTIVFIIMILFKEKIANLFFSNQQYAFVVYLSAIATLVGSTNSIISAPTRMENKRKVFLVTNTISPLLSYSISIPLLLAGHYIIALPLSAILSGITIEIIFGALNRKWFSFRFFDANVLKQLLKIAIPLLPNFLIYWIFNSCDRIMITNIIGIEYAGIYSVSSKFGHVSQLIYIGFAGGWQYFAFSTMKDENQVRNNSLVFEYLGVISYITTSFVCACCYVFYLIIVPKDYLAGYVAAPYLFLSPLLQMLFQIAANQFLVIKKTWPNMFILAVGAMLNVLINKSMIPLIGIEGAAIATLIGYSTSVAIACCVLIRMRLIVLSSRFLMTSGVFLVLLLLWRLTYSQNTFVGLLFAFSFLLACTYFYKNEIKYLREVFKEHVNK